MVKETENVSLSSFCNLYQNSIIGIFYCSVVALSYLSFASHVFLILVSAVSQMFLPKSLELGFTRICSHITPMQVVSMQPCEKHRVFKVSLFLLWFQHDHILIQMFLTLICVCVCVCVRFRLKLLGVPTWWWQALQKRPSITLTIFVTWL